MTFPATLAGLPADLLKPLPFFVYGTLQTGYTNHANVVRGRLDSVAPARISGGEVFHFPAGYPGLYETPEAVDNVVIGQLITAATTTPEELGIYYELLEELDALEEFFAPGDPRNVYERVERDVTVSAPQYREDLSIDGAGAAPSAGTTTVSVRAWVYICKIDQETAKAIHVPHGDWRRFMTEGGLKDAGDDWAATLAKKQAEAAALSELSASTP